MDTNEIGFSIIIEAQWENVTERIRLDYGSSNQLTQVHSRENWKGKIGMVIYTPRVLSHAFEDGCYSVELAYLKSDHAHFPDDVRKDVYWGRMQLVFRFKGGIPVLNRDDMHWLGEGENGPPTQVEIRKEESAELIETAIKVRKRQQRFKRELCNLAKPPRCEISGETMEELLDAAHIIAVADGGSDEVENGLLLRADLHRLYDADCFRICPDGSLELTPKKELPSSYKESFKTWSVQGIKPEVMQRIRLSLEKKLQVSKEKRLEHRYSV